MTDQEITPDIAIQRDFYRRIADQYDLLQLENALEHHRALAWLQELVAEGGAKSLLDVGSGTGRVLSHFANRSINVIDVEPSAHLRANGYTKGLHEGPLIDIDATRLAFSDSSFDIVCAFGVPHHVRDHTAAVREMTRVARISIFISDSNIFGHGSAPTRLLKQTLRATRLWRLFDWDRTSGKSWHFSEGDGLFYSYSLFDDDPILRDKFNHLRWMATRPSASNLYRSASSVAVFATNHDDYRMVKD